MTNDAPKEIPVRLRRWVNFSIFTALVLISLYFLRFPTGYFSQAQDAWGQFGDYVGGILNPLFSLTALFALLHTIKLQSKELHESTEHLKASSQALALQNEVLMRQQFETTFFQMLAFFSEVIRDMESPSNTKGRSCIRELYKSMLTQLRSSDSDETIKAKYRHFHNQYNYLLGHYFRTLYSIIKFVDKCLLSDEDKKFYTNIVRAQLSEHDLALLFYNCLSLDDYERSKFLPLVKKYDLLEYLNDKFLADPAHRDLLSL